VADELSPLLYMRLDVDSDSDDDAFEEAAEAAEAAGGRRARTRVVRTEEELQERESTRMLAALAVVPWERKVEGVVGLLLGNLCVWHKVCVRVCVCVLALLSSLTSLTGLSLLAGRGAGGPVQGGRAPGAGSVAGPSRAHAGGGGGREGGGPPGPPGLQVPQPPGGRDGLAAHRVVHGERGLATLEIIWGKWVVRRSTACVTLQLNVCPGFNRVCNHHSMQMLGTHSVLCDALSSALLYGGSHSVVEAGEHGHAALHPEARLAVRGQAHFTHEVGGVARGAQHAAAVAGLVQWAAAGAAPAGVPSAV
jgi:hypothetical protein